VNDVEAGSRSENDAREAARIALRGGHVALGATALYVVTSLLDWEPFSAPGGKVVFLAGITVIGLLGWEIARMAELGFALHPEMADTVSVSMALSLVLFSIGALTSRLDRPWPEWMAVVLSTVIVLGTLLRAAAFQLQRMAATFRSQSHARRQPG